MYHNDDGSTFGGIVTVFLCFACFCGGYWVRDQGITFKVQIGANGEFGQNRTLRLKSSLRELSQLPHDR